MFKYKIKIILKSGYEIRVRAKEYNFIIDIDENFFNLEFKKANEKYCYISNNEIASIIAKKWFQRWD